MSASDPDLVEPDPIDSDDPVELRRAVLSARDTALGAEARSEVLAHRVDELEGELHALGAHADELRARLDRSVADRALRVLGRLRRMVRDR